MKTKLMNISSKNMIKISLRIAITILIVIPVLLISKQSFAATSADVYNRDIYENAANRKATDPGFEEQQDKVDVDTATGEVDVAKTDLLLKGKNGLDFSLTRHYSSNQANNMRPFVNTSNNIVYKVHGKKTTRKTDANGNTLSLKDKDGNDIPNPVDQYLAYGPYDNQDIASTAAWHLNNGWWNTNVGPIYDKDSGQIIYIHTTYSDFIVQNDVGTYITMTYQDYNDITKPLRMLHLIMVHIRYQRQMIWLINVITNN